MIKKALLQVARDHQEWYSFAHLMDSLAAEYLEGEIDSSCNLFNEWFNRMGVHSLRVLADITVFDSIKRICEQRIHKLDELKRLQS